MALHGDNTGSGSRDGGSVIPADTIILATDDSEAGVSDARLWIKAQAFTADDVRLIKRDGQCLVIAKRPISPRGGCGRMDKRRSEANISNDIQIALSQAGCLVFRNNVGCLPDRTGRPVRYGVGSNGGSDLIGIAPGGVFLAIECKTAIGQPTTAQLNFIAAVIRQGGRAGVARSGAEAVAIALGQPST